MKVQSSFNHVTATSGEYLNNFLSLESKSLVRNFSSLPQTLHAKLSNYFTPEGSSGSDDSIVFLISLNSYTISAE